MKISIKNFIRKYGLLITAIMVFILTFMINKSVRLYGDDFHYKQFSSVDFSYYLKRNAEHYFLANGRVIVHLLVTFFLSLPPVFWALFNSLMLSGIVFFGAKTASVNNSENGNFEFSSGIIFAVTILFLSPSLTRQSVYWLAGSFNYVYPLFMLLVYWFLLTRPVYTKALKWTIPAAAFLSAASVEQVSLMAFGLTLLFIINKAFFKKQKIEGFLFVSLALALIGLATIIFSPAVAYRASLEDAPAAGLINLLKYNIKNQGITFLLSPIMVPFHLIAMVGSLAKIYYYKKSEVKTCGFAAHAVLILGLSALVCWLWQITLGKAEINYQIVDMKHLLIYSAIAAGYLVSLFYSAILEYRATKYNNALPLIAFILCIGSQVMMIVSPVYGPRNLLCAIVMLALYSSSLLPSIKDMRIIAVLSCLACFVFNLPLLSFIPIAALFIYSFSSSKKLKHHNLTVLSSDFVIISGYIVLILVSGITYMKTYNGYMANKKIYDRNLKNAEIFKQSNGESLTQFMLLDDTYGWVMPYHNPYYDPYYKSYIGIDTKKGIVWEKANR